MKIRAFAFVVFGLCLQPGLVVAEHKIHFSITEQTLIEHDQITVQLLAHAQAENPQAVSQQINQTMRQALSQLNPQERKLAQTGNYNLRPHHDRTGIITHWQGQQHLSLTLPIELDVSGILLRLQTYLNYHAMQTEISHIKQAQAEKELTQQALKTYQAQAKLIAESFGQTQYKLEETHIQTQQPSHPFAQPRMALASATIDNAPVIEGGKKMISLTVSGVIKLD